MSRHHLVKRPGSSQTEIGNLDPALSVHQDIRRLDIAMYIVVLVGLSAIILLKMTEVLTACM